ncbi:SapC family protein [Ruegeria sp.]|uniref:SapC family protein n=1 Tax=Ruegeria sp. TaxID=1879320 RepID=UPI003B5C8830
MAQDALVPVSFARHGQRYWRRFTSYQFAAADTDCAIVLEEVTQIAAAFPILFKQVKDRIEPRAIFSLSPAASNPFVSWDGQWMAAYVPSALRCHPFSAQRLNQNETFGKPQLRLAVDESTGFVTDDPRNEAFFDESGALSPALRKVQTFLKTCTAADSATASICQKIHSLGLFEPVEKYDGIALPPGSLRISAERLIQLSQNQKLELLEAGAFLMIHSHQVSLSHCAWLYRAQHQGSGQEKYTEYSDISGFLTAIANAQSDVILGTERV